MKLPFIQQRGIGVHITGKSIRWIDLVRTGNSLRILTVDEEPLTDSMEESLSRLVSRVKPDYPFVSTNLRPDQVKEFVVPLPEFDDEEYQESWLHEQERIIKSSESGSDDLHISHHFWENGDEGKCLFVVASDQAVRQRKELLDSVGLTPVCLTSGTVERTYSCLFNEEFAEGDQQLLHIGKEEAILYDLKNGILTEMIAMDHAGNSISDTIEEALTLLISGKNVRDSISTQQHGLFVSTENADKETVTSREIGGQTFNVVALQPLKSVKSKVGKPGIHFTTCAGMAVKQLYPALDSVNLLGEEEQVFVREQIQKKDSLLTGILIPGSVVLIWLLIMAVQGYHQSQLTNASEQVEQLNNKITAVANADSSLSRWVRKVEQARELVAQRTRFASLMETIGKTVPNGVWFTGMNIRNEQSQSQVKLQGLSNSENHVATLMEHLEHTDRLSDVRLVLSDRVQEKDIYKKGRYANVPLVKFEIRFRSKE